LKISIDPPDTQFARDLSISIGRGDINQMSFSFQVMEEEWERGEKKELDLRTIKRVKLFDISPVTFPAYEGTDIAVRSHDAWRKEEEEKEKKLPPENDEAWKIDILRKRLQMKNKQITGGI
jgi:phage head maturation protease